MQTFEIRSDYNETTFYDTPRTKFLAQFGFMESGKVITGNPNWTGEVTVEQELMDTLAAEITAEIDREILKNLMGKIC